MCCFFVARFFLFNVVSVVFFLVEYICVFFCICIVFIFECWFFDIMYFKFLNCLIWFVFNLIFFCCGMRSFVVANCFMVSFLSASKCFLWLIVLWLILNDLGGGGGLISVFLVLSVLCLVCLVVCWMDFSCLCCFLRNCLNLCVWLLFVVLCEWLCECEDDDDVEVLCFECFECLLVWLWGLGDGMCVGLGLRDERSDARRVARASVCECEIEIYVLILFDVICLECLWCLSLRLSFYVWCVVFFLCLFVFCRFCVNRLGRFWTRCGVRVGWFMCCGWFCGNFWVCLLGV